MNIRRKIVGTGVRLFLSVGAMIAATTFGVGSAQAGVTQIKDGFDQPATWSTFKSGGTAAFFIGAGSSARTPPNLASLLWFGGGSTQDWAQIGKAFFWNNTQGGGDHPVFTGCAARVYLKPNLVNTPVSGQIEMINTILSTYVGIKTFSLPANAGWTPITVGNSWACSPWLTFRIVVPNNTQVRGVLADDMTLQWFF